MVFKTAGAVFAAAVCSLAASATPNEALGWLSGDWCTESDGAFIEETWLAPHGTIMLGLSRTQVDGRTVGFEYLRIVEVDGVQTLFAQPGGRPPTAFARTASGTQWIRFENPDHDFPKSIEYRRDGESLLAEIAGPGDSAEETVILFDFSRCPT